MYTISLSSIILTIAVLSLNIVCIIMSIFSERRMQKKIDSLEATISALEEKDTLRGSTDGR